MARCRPFGEPTWKEKTVPAMETHALFTSLQPFHEYECMLALNTTIGSYYTKSQIVFVAGKGKPLQYFPFFIHPVFHPLLNCLALLIAA